MKKLSFKEIIELRNSLPHGAILKISERIGVTREYMSLVLNGHILGSNGDKYMQVIEAVQNYPKRKDPVQIKRTDLLAALPRGYQMKIADELGIGNEYVSAVLNGRIDQNKPKPADIIRLAEFYAEREIVKQRRSVCPTLK